MNNGYGPAAQANVRASGGSANLGPPTQRPATELESVIGRLGEVLQEFENQTARVMLLGDMFGGVAPSNGVSQVQVADKHSEDRISTLRQRVNGLEVCCGALREHINRLEAYL